MLRLAFIGSFLFLLPGCINGGSAPGYGTPAPRSTGIYDQADQFEDERGFPLPGWSYMKYPAPR
jgi:hypothetical protein